MAQNIYLQEGIIQIEDLTFNERAFVSLAYQLNATDPQYYKRAYYAKYMNIDERSISRYVITCVQKGYLKAQYNGNEGIMLTPTEKTIQLYKECEIF